MFLVDGFNKDIQLIGLSVSTLPWASFKTAVNWIVLPTMTELEGEVISICATLIICSGFLLHPISREESRIK